jgi:hypothetical protein
MNVLFLELQNVPKFYRSIMVCLVSHSTFEFVDDYYCQDFAPSALSAPRSEVAETDFSTHRDSVTSNPLSQCRVEPSTNTKSSPCGQLPERIIASNCNMPFQSEFPKEG